MHIHFHISRDIDCAIHSKTPHRRLVRCKVQKRVRLWDSLGGKLRKWAKTPNDWGICGQGRVFGPPAYTPTFTVICFGIFLQASVHHNKSLSNSCYKPWKSPQTRNKDKKTMLMTKWPARQTNGRVWSKMGINALPLPFRRAPHEALLELTHSDISTFNSN